MIFDKETKGHSYPTHLFDNLQDLGISLEYPPRPVDLILGNLKSQVSHDGFLRTLLHVAKIACDLREGACYSYTVQWVNKKNPEIPELMQDLNFRLVRLAKRLERPSQDWSESDIERVVVYRCIRAGVALMAREYASQLFAGKTVAKVMNEIWPKYSANRNKNDIPNEDVWDNLEQARNHYQLALRHVGDPTVLFATTADRLITDVKDTAGGYFVQLAVRRFVKFGLPLAEAVSTLVGQPPTTMADLKNPLPFARQLIFDPRSSIVKQTRPILTSVHS